jgi:hypothetical protein
MKAARAMASNSISKLKSQNESVRRPVSANAGSWPVRKWGLGLARWARSRRSTEQFA